ncbi:MAG: alpha/beta hydrolase [Candidatus Eisenbacteria bacterium]|uniref:Alpha/beta hydrolase n=1 Tax=Eiseniibacteriota bacterium TaxID=2212470 RepID=A0A538TXR5_UNCEI|nr:MAG: alpha/beta hydrolase [Candidatus Eisenbacteria bacterium]
MRYIHRFVPPSVAGASPRTLLLLHGTGGNEDDLLPLGPMLDPVAALVSPRGDVLENGMPRFFRRLREGVFDEADLRVRAQALAAFVEEMRAAHGLGPVIAVGFSNGANVATAVLLLHPGALAGAVLFAAMVPIVPDPLPDLSRVPVWIGEGREDPMVPVEEAERLAALLQRANADVTLHWHPGGHALHPAEVAAARAWLVDRRS